METRLEFRDLTLDVEFDYQPEEKDVSYLSNGDPGSPGCAESFEVTKITCGKIDMTEFFMEYDDASQIFIALEKAFIEKFREDCNERADY